jgi:two-component system sensor histidine kinase VicK
VLSLQYPDAVKAERMAGGRSLALLFAPFRSETQGGIMAVIHDVTEQKRTEEIRREFVANVSTSFERRLPISEATQRPLPTGKTSRP